MDLGRILEDLAGALYMLGIDVEEHFIWELVVLVANDVAAKVYGYTRRNRLSQEDRVTKSGLASAEKASAPNWTGTMK
jgi:hypothetical protein